MTPENQASAAATAGEPSVEMLEDLCIKFILTAPRDALR